MISLSVRAVFFRSCCLCVRFFFWESVFWESGFLEGSVLCLFLFDIHPSVDLVGGPPSLSVGYIFCFASCTSYCT